MLRHDESLARILGGIDSEGPGAALAVVEGEELTGFASAGLMNIEHGLAIARETVHYLGSTSKQFVACAIAILEDDGRLALSDDIRDYLPEVAQLPTRIEIAHLLHHTSGIRDKYSLRSVGGLSDETVATDAGSLALLSKQRTLNFEPGSRFMYSNSGYFLLAQIVGRVSGMPMREFAARNIFEPTGMTRTLFRDDPDEPLHHRASGHRPTAAGWRLAEYRYSSLGPGGVWSTVDDMLAWNRALDSGQLLPIERLLRTRPLLDGSPNSYAFGVMLHEFHGERVQSHAGGVQGHTADFVRLPDRSLAIIAFSNGGASANALAMRAARSVLNVSTPGADPSPADAPSKADVARCLGTYVDGDFTQTLTIEIDEDDAVVVRYNDVKLPVGVSSPGVLEGSGVKILLGDGVLDASFPWALDHRAERFSRLTEPARTLAPTDGGVYESDELGVSLRLVVSANQIRMARDDDEAVELRGLADDVYLWPITASGQSGELLLRVIRDSNGRATELRTGAGRAVNISFRRVHERPGREFRESVVDATLTQLELPERA